MKVGCFYYGQFTKGFKARYRLEIELAKIVQLVQSLSDQDSDYIWEGSGS
jgi:hypothetical protein